jgi:phage terminase large subunit-like protein
VARNLEQNPWIPVVPTIPQLRFLALPHREALYGGAAGGGKSEALLMGAAQFVELPNYAAVLFRRTHTDLALEGALMDRAADWFSGTAAKWNSQDKRWTFPSGASITFGYMDSPNAWRRYDSTEWQYIGFDEATQFRPHDINALIGRLRKKADNPIPLRFRLGSNPGGEAHDFLGERYVNPESPHPERIFVPALLEDNPYINREEYEETLEALKDADPLLYEQRRWGVWIKDEAENRFKEQWWSGKNRYLESETHAMWNQTVARYGGLDTAETDEENSAYTVLTIGDVMPDYRLALRYVARERLEFPDLLEWVKDEVGQWLYDHKLATIAVENASSGRQLLQTVRKEGPMWLAKRLVAVQPHPKGKEEGWKIPAMWAKRGMLLLPYPHANYPWLFPYTKELFNVPNSEYKDQADSTAILMNHVENDTAAFSTRWLALNAEEERRLAVA